MNGKRKRVTAILLAILLCTNGMIMQVKAEPEQETAENTTPEPYADGEGLVLDLDMEELANGVITNKVDGQTFAVKGNTPALAQGLSGHGNALRFDGSNYVDLGQVFQPENAYTVMGWLNMDEGGKTAQAFIGRGVSGNVDSQLAALIKNEQIYHCVATSNGSANSVYNEYMGASVPAGTWTHIAITRNGSQLLYYINGELSYTAPDMPDSGFVSSSLNWFLGKDEGSGGVWDEHNFTGLMDDVRLYSSALNEAQIKSAANIVSGHNIEEASNGMLKVVFGQVPNPEPALADFKLSFTVDGKNVTPAITDYAYDAATLTAVFTFDPISNLNPVEKSVEVSVAYGITMANGSFTIPAGNNQAPSVEDTAVINLSTKLGEEPHVKGMLKVQYVYQDPDNDAEGDSKYQWYISDTKDGEYTALQGIHTQTVILLDKYVDKYLKCQVTPSDLNGNQGTPVMSTEMGPVQATEGNPLTDWFLNAQFGVSHHILSEFVNLDFVSTSPEEKWDSSKQTWNEFIGQFDAEAYASQISQTGAKFVIITLGQNAAEYCAPNLVYDKYLREAGLLGEDEENPKTVSFENDLPMKMADALAPYDIKVMLYLPSNVPHSAHWDSAARDYLITEKALKGQRGSDGPNSQEAKKIHCEMVKWWSEHYGDKISGWWFDGMYPGGTLESQKDMSQEYNVSTLANAAKAGNPYNIITFNQGTSANWAFGKNTEYHDFTAGECNNFNLFPQDGRWAKDTTDCQNFLFGPVGTGGWQWGAAGVRNRDTYVEEQAQKAISKSYVLGFDVKANHFGNVDPQQLAQLIRLKDTLEKSDDYKDNLALNKPVNSSTDYSPDYDAAKAVDGSSSTRWSASGNSTAYPDNVGEYLEIDLETPQTIGSARIEYYINVPNKPVNVPDHVTIQVRQTKEDEWVTVLSRAKTPAVNSDDSFRVDYGFPDITARYVRLLFEDGTKVNKNNIALSEVGLYAPIDKSRLTDLIARAESYKKENYSDASYKALREAIQAAKDKQPLIHTEDELNDAVNILQGYIDGLVSVYKATIVGGSGSGNYEEGKQVNVSASVPDGKEFVNWISGDVVLADPGAVTTSFRMPAKSVTVTARFKEIKPGGDNEDNNYIYRVLAGQKNEPTITGDQIHKDARLTIESLKLDSGMACNELKKFMDSHTGDSVWTGNLNLTKDFKGRLTVSFPVDTKYDGQKVLVLHTDGEQLERYDTTVSAGKVVVTVESLTNFAVYINPLEKPANTPDHKPSDNDGGSSGSGSSSGDDTAAQNADTGDWAQTAIWFTLMLISAAALSLMVFRKIAFRKKEVRK